MGPVTEQSEHLSSAQIENYGIRTSGAGPEAIQRDEHQRVNHQSIDDQSINDPRVEAHLADCASCRNSLLEFHRNLFASSANLPEPDRPITDKPKNDLPDHDTSLFGHSLSGHSSSGYSPSDQRSADSRLEGARPTDSALADSKFANPNNPADPLVRTAPTPECPGTDALRELAAGLTPGDRAPALIHHAATCDHCGPLLRTFTEDFSDDFSAEEQAALNSLQSASAAWQKKTARKMLKPSPKPIPWIFSWKWIMTPAAATATCALLALCIGGTLYAKRDTPGKTEALLAQAYTEKRTIKMRWPGAKHGAYSVSRGSSAQAIPYALMQAEEILENRTQAQIGSGKWDRARAEKEIAVGNPDSSVAILEPAIRSGLASIESKLDLAIAYFLQGEQNRSQERYQRSLEALDMVLQQQPGNAVALFNRALVYERLGQLDKAEKDWNIFLQIETDAAWLSEAKEELRNIQVDRTGK